MIAKNENIQELTNLFKELSIQVDLLAIKKNDAERSAQQYAKELNELHAQQREASQKLRNLETSSCSMWENIGDGG